MAFAKCTIVLILLLTVVVATTALSPCSKVRDSKASLINVD